MVFRAKSLLISPTHFSFVTGHPDHITHAEFRMGGSTNLVFVFFGGVGKFELGASAGLSTNSALSSLSALAFPTRIVSCFVCFPSSATLHWKKTKIALHISDIAINRHFFRPLPGLSSAFPPSFPRLLNQLGAFSLALSPAQNQISFPAEFPSAGLLVLLCP